jgi:hypothetical protein
VQLAPITCFAVVPHKAYLLSTQINNMRSAAMTPFKQPRLLPPDVDEMEADSELESPPSPSSRRLTMRVGADNRLFAADDDNEAVGFTLQEKDRKNGKTPTKYGIPKGKILKPVDLNLSLEEDDDNEDGIAVDETVTSQDIQRRKRLQKLAESSRRESHTPTRTTCPLQATDAMVASPYISPSSYITIDGRCVTSKNPFSPMVEDSTPKSLAVVPRHNITAAAPSFPISFDTCYGDSAIDSAEKKNSSATSVGKIAPPTCRHRLQKRDASSWASPSKRSFLYASLTRDGYPERTGRYSFTGSPIKEDEDSSMEISSSSPSKTAANKIRRLRLKDDVHYPNRNLVIDTLGQNFSSSFEEVSPTDIMSFPAPPTPTKSKKGSEPYHHVSIPPETPFLSRSGRRQRRSGNEMGNIDTRGVNCHSEEETCSNSTSRFKSDFDVIGELGKGKKTSSPA